MLAPVTADVCWLHNSTYPSWWSHSLYLPYDYVALTIPSLETKAPELIICPRPAHVEAVVQRLTVHSLGFSWSSLYILMVFDLGVLRLPQSFYATLIYQLKFDKNSRRISYNKEFPIMLWPVLSKQQPQALVGCLELEVWHIDGTIIT